MICLGAFGWSTSVSCQRQSLFVKSAELARVRRELDSLPTVDQLENLGASKRVGSLHDVWTDCDPADQRDLLRLRVREVQVDVVTGRAVSLLS